MATQVSLNDGAVASAGALAIQTNGTTQAVIISTGQVATLAQNPILTSGTANGVAYLNGSKVLTTGSALTFDGSALSVSASVASATLASSGAYSALSFTNSGGAAASGTILANSSGILQSRAATHAYTNANASSEYMRIDSSGNLLVGTTGLGTVGLSSGFQITPSGAMYSASTGDSVFSRRSTDGTVITFRRDTTSVGSIDVTTTATSYVTSSDYRLKNTIAPMTGALAKVALLKPCTYKWNSSGSNGQGFIAHELQAVVPDCVTGDKDAVDEDGNPKYQGVDTSFLVATLTAAIQEQQTLITTLTARITALESA
jgi:hypothetical protein